MDTGPFATEAEASAAARALGGPPEPGWSILSGEQRLRMLTAACEEAGVELGAYDARVLAWLSGWEDGICGVIAGLITRRQDEAIRLLEQALFLHQNGERPPGAPHDQPEAETWAKLWRDIETFLRERRPGVAEGDAGRVD